MQKNYWRVMINILAFVGALCIIWEVVDYVRNENPLKYNPRHAINGIDTVYASDSVYTIKVEIKNVQPEPPTEQIDYR